jgi:hypothetical protein
MIFLSLYPYRIACTIGIAADAFSTQDPQKCIFKFFSILCFGKVYFECYTQQLLILAVCDENVTIHFVMFECLLCIF